MGKLTLMSEPGRSPSSRMVRMMPGAWASAVSTLGTGTGVVYTLKVTITIESSNFDGVADPAFIMDDCALELPIDNTVL